MTIRFLLGLLVVLAACENQEEREARQLEEIRRKAAEAQSKVSAETQARLEAEQKAMDEEQARLERFDLVTAGRRFVQSGLAQEPDPAQTCERIVDDATITSIRVEERGLEILGAACQAGDARARACLAYLVDNIHQESRLTRHLEALTGACVKHDPAAFTLPE